MYIINVNITYKGKVPIQNPLFRTIVLGNLKIKTIPIKTVNQDNNLKDSLYLNLYRSDKFSFFKMCMPDWCSSI